LRRICARNRRTSRSSRCTSSLSTLTSELTAKGAQFTRPVSNEGFGLMTALQIPGGGELGLYEPRHASPIAPSATD